MKSERASDRRAQPLRAALVATADLLIRERGVEGFTLREAARRAGVSPGAPAHHFGSATGLLTEVAVLGYLALGRYMADVQVTGEAPRDVRAFCTQYVVHALDQPGRFRLMCRTDLVDTSSAAFVEAGRDAMTLFASTAAAYHGDDLAPRGPGDVSPGMLAILATAHGLAHMAIDGKWDFALDPHRRRADLLDRLLPGTLAAQFPDR